MYLGETQSPFGELSCTTAMFLLEKKFTYPNYLANLQMFHNPLKNRGFFFFSQLFSLPLGHVISEQHRNLLLQCLDLTFKLFSWFRSSDNLAIRLAVESKFAYSVAFVTIIVWVLLCSLKKKKKPQKIPHNFPLDPSLAVSVVRIHLRLEKTPRRGVGKCTTLPAVKLGKISKCIPSCFLLSVETSI